MTVAMNWPPDDRGWEVLARRMAMECSAGDDASPVWFMPCPHGEDHVSLIIGAVAPADVVRQGLIPTSWDDLTRTLFGDEP